MQYEIMCTYVEQARVSCRYVPIIVMPQLSQVALRVGICPQGRGIFTAIFRGFFKLNTNFHLILNGFAT